MKKEATSSVRGPCLVHRLRSTSESFAGRNSFHVFTQVAAVCSQECYMWDKVATFFTVQRERREGDNGKIRIQKRKKRDVGGEDTKDIRRFYIQRNCCTYLFIIGHDCVLRNRVEPHSHLKL